jgi:hypothetical protein
VLSVRGVLSGINNTGAQMNLPLAIERRASSVGDLQTTFALIDAKRMEYLAGVLAEAGRPVAAEMALGFAAEYRGLADRLSGAVEIGAAE